MVLILNIETSTKVCSVSLSKDGELISFKEESSDKYIHSEKLNLFIEDVIAQTNYKLTDLDAVCVSKGPGSYTGLRIGVSCAKGLCYALDIPLISIDSLSVLANGYIESHPIEANATVAPMIDARRMEVYTTTFDSSSKMLEPISAKVLDDTTFYLSSNIIFIGDGAEKCRDIISSSMKIESYFSTSKGMIRLSYKKYLDNDFEDVAYFEPFYLKDFKAG